MFLLDIVGIVVVVIAAYVIYKSFTPTGFDLKAGWSSFVSIFKI
jgi:hypothetical protein